jgi:hypothetical protein
MQESQLLLKRLYSDYTQQLDISSLAKALQVWYLDYPAHHFLHPCVIDGKPALVCRAGLSREDNQAFAELQAIALHYGIYLKEDSRQRDDASLINNRRRSVGLVLSFCLSMLATSRVVTAQDLQSVGKVSSIASQLADQTHGMQANLSIDSNGTKVIRIRQSQAPSAAEVLAAYSQKQATLTSDKIQIDKIAGFLSAAYQAEPGDPAHIADDLATIADYYAHYPQVIDLLSELSGHKLVLKYRRNTWLAQAWGSQFTVDSVTIYFDTRLGAQLLNDPGCDSSPACSISPADALLHELLHAKLMLLDSQHFIDGGGMAQTLYPFEHEREVINHENRLYQDMNQLDGRARPLRHRHSGELLQVSCPACNPTKQVASSGPNL